MDLNQMYMSSPDWIKGLMVLLPFVTAYGIARLFAPRASGTPAPAAPERMHAATMLMTDYSVTHPSGLPAISPSMERSARGIFPAEP